MFFAAAAAALLLTGSVAPVTPAFAVTSNTGSQVTLNSFTPPTSVMTFGLLSLISDVWDHVKDVGSGIVKRIRNAVSDVWDDVKEKIVKEIRGRTISWILKTGLPAMGIPIPPQIIDAILTYQEIKSQDRHQDETPDSLETLPESVLEDILRLSPPENSNLHTSSGPSGPKVPSKSDELCPTYPIGYRVLCASIGQSQNMTNGD